MEDSVQRDEFILTTQHFWNKHNASGLKYRADILLARAFISRGQIQRRLQFADIGLQ